ncbi:MAG TPA: DMT family transporter [Steroidobacteraceae bacterium]
MRIYLKLALASLAWAATYHVAKYTVGSLSPLAAMLWRFALAAVVLAPWVAAREGWPAAAVRRNALPLLAMGLVGAIGFNLGMFYGLRATSAVNASLIMGLAPSLTMACATLLTGRRPGVRLLLGLLLGLSGVATVVSGGSWRVLRALEFSRGDLLMLGGTLCWAIYSLLPQRFVRDLSPMAITASSLTIAAVTMLVLGVTATPEALQWPGPALGAVLFMGLVATALAYLWWIEGVAKLGAVRTAVFSNLTPVFTALIAVMLGQTLLWAQCVGAVLVIGGLIVATRA